MHKIKQFLIIAVIFIILWAVMSALSSYGVRALNSPGSSYEHLKVGFPVYYLTSDLGSIKVNYLGLLVDLFFISIISCVIHKKFFSINTLTDQDIRSPKAETS